MCVFSFVSGNRSWNVGSRERVEAGMWTGELVGWPGGHAAEAGRASWLALHSFRLGSTPVENRF